MITKYTNFINENWQVSFKEEVDILVKDVITSDEIEDAFLELFEEHGFRYTIKNRPGHFDVWLSGIGDKKDLVQFKCYPFIEIKMSKTITGKRNFDSTQKTLQEYVKYIDKVKIACKRILYKKDDLILVEELVDVRDLDLNFRIILKVNKRLKPYQNKKEKRELPTNRIIDKISRNKIFKLGIVTDNEIYFATDKMPNIDRIVLGMFRHFIDNKSIRLLEIGECEYKIEIL